MDEVNFSYRGCRFTCAAHRTATEVYVARAQYVDGLYGAKRCELPHDPAPFATEVEALRHAERQVLQWLKDRMGDAAPSSKAGAA